MGSSQVAQDLLGQDRLQYGDPCFQIEWESYKDECRGAAGDPLAVAVFESYGVSTTNAPGGNNWTSCCPLDIFNQDPFSIIRMSLDAKLLDREYWEVYADEFGKARFTQILKGSDFGTNNKATLPPVRHCGLSARPWPMADLVIIRSGDAPPYRKCGDWIQILPGSDGHAIRAGDNLFGDGKNSQGVHFAWGQATSFLSGAVYGYAAQNTDYTCSHGLFDQHVTIIYPEYDRKQEYKDGIRDIWEIKGFESVLTWLVDINFNSTKDILRHYSINFTKSSEIPLFLIPGSRAVTFRDFPPTCSFYDPNAKTDDCKPNQNNPTDEGCTTATEAWNQSAKLRQDVTPAMPVYIQYECLTPQLGFWETNRWLYWGSERCAGDDQADICYESTAGIMANGTALNGFSWQKGDTGYHFGEPTWKWVDLIDFGTQGELTTIEVPHDEAWIELRNLTEMFIKPEYGMRWRFPDSTNQYTFVRDPRPEAFGPNTPKAWINPIRNYFRTILSYRFAGYVGSSTSCGYYRWPGLLFPMQDSLYLLDSGFFARVQITRPGLHIKGAGRSVDPFFRNINMRVMPVYSVDVPPAIGYCGRNSAGWVNAYADLRDAMYCTVEDDVTEMEKLQTISNGIVVDYTLPFYMPEFDHTDTDESKFDDVSQNCQKIAEMLYNYLAKWNDVADKSYTLVCDPPASQTEVPHLGEVVNVGNRDRCINTISYQYQDKSSFLLNIETGPAELSIAAGGATFTHYKTETVQVVGRVISSQMGALYKVHVNGIGDIKAWNMATYPWDIGDRVKVTIYNNPKTH